MNFQKFFKEDTEIKCVAAIDPVKNTACVFEKNSMKIQPLNKVDSDAVNIISVKFKDTQNTRVQSILSGEELENEIKIQTRRNLNLDDHAEYIIKYREIDAGQYETYSLNFETLQLLTQDTIEALKYIDFVVPQPFLFEGLYEAGILPADSIHCFLYLDVDDAFLALYNKGKFSFARGLGRYNLGYLNAQYTQATGIASPDEVFLNDLKAEGANGGFNAVLSDMAFYLGDIFNGTSSLANSAIDKIYVGSCVGEIPGLANLISQNLSRETADFDFNNKIEGADLDPSCMNVIKYYFAKNCSKDDNMNFSAFMRPPVFLKRDGGQFIAVVVAATILGLFAPALDLLESLYHFGWSYYDNQKLSIRKEKLGILQPEYDSIKSQIKRQIADIDALKSTINISKKLLDDSYKKKTEYKAKSEFLSDMSNFISDASVKAKSLRIDDKDVQISVLSNDDTKISGLIENINNSKKYSVKTKQISLVGNGNSNYESNITVGYLK